MRRSTRGFTLIELMIIVAILGVWLISIPPLLPDTWRHFVRLSTDHAALESTVRLHAYLARDLESAAPRSETPRSLVLSLPGGRTVRYVTDTMPSRVRREEAGRWTTFPDSRLAVLTPAIPQGAWTIRVESTVRDRRPPPVLVSVWPKEVH